jgi:hypothetical protein
MANFMVATGAPRGGYALGVAAWFVLGALLLNQIGLEIFAGAMSVTFISSRQSALGLDLLTKSQRLWVENTRNSMRTRAERTLAFAPWFPAAHALAQVDVTRRWAYDAFTTSSFPEHFFMAVSVLNLVAMAYFYLGMPRETFLQLRSLDNMFMAAFLLEMALLHFALGAAQYWADAWMRLDGIVCLASAASYVLPSLAASTPLGSFSVTLRSLLRLARILRVLRIARTVPRLATLLRTLYLAAPSVLNIVALYCVCLYIFAVVSGRGAARALGPGQGLPGPPSSPPCLASDTHTHSPSLNTRCPPGGHERL